jgi:hypothetical protein
MSDGRQIIDAPARARRATHRAEWPGRIEPIDKKQAGRELSVLAADIGAGKHGDLVSVDLVGKTRFGAPRARVRVARLGHGRKAVSLISLRARMTFRMCFTRGRRRAAQPRDFAGARGLARTAA